MRKLGLQAVVSLSVAGIAFACASEPPDDFVPPEGSSSSGSSTIPGGDGGGTSSSGGSSGASSSGGSSGDAATDGSTGVPADCTKMGTVDSRPACDSCTKQKCCKELQACAASAACKSAQDCVAKCAEDDFFCVLQCSSGPGSDELQGVAACASQQCKTECPSSFDFDGGFDFDAF